MGRRVPCVGNDDRHHQLCFIEFLILIFAAALLCWLDGVGARSQGRYPHRGSNHRHYSPHVGLAQWGQENARTSFLGAGITLVLERLDNSPWISHCRA